MTDSSWKYQLQLQADWNFRTYWRSQSAWIDKK